jgi:hypothetical protein
MGKITINGTEIEFDMEKTKQLSDDDLVTVSGGFQPIEKIYFYSWVCNTCYTEGATFIANDNALKDSMKAHKSLTGHCDYTGIVAFYRDGLGYCVCGIWKETI